MNRSVRHRLDSPLVPLLVITLLLSLFTFGMLRRAGFDASSFVTAGDMFSDPAAVAHNLSVLKNSAGFDGQFYYRLALDPFTSRRTDFGVTLDMPSLRQQRILYPLMAWALSAGSPTLVPWAMLLINFSALCLLGWLGGVYAQTLKQHALWGLLLPLYPGSLLSLTRDLVEVLEVTLLVSSLLLLRRGRHVFAALLLTLAVLAKETALLAAVAAMLVYIFDWWGVRQGRVRWYYFALPLATWLVWQTALFLNWGELPVLAGRMNLGAPFAGFVSFLGDAAALQTPLQRRSFPELMFLIALALGVVYHLRSTSASLQEIISCFLYAILALSLSRVIWVEDWTFLRAVSEFCVLAIIIIVGSRGSLQTRAAILGAIPILWLFIFFRLLRHGD